MNRNFAVSQKRAGIPLLTCRPLGKNSQYLVNLNQVVAIKCRTDGRGDELYTVDGRAFETGSYDTGEFQPDRWDYCIVD